MQKQRVLSLDVFRGMTICLMIIVNTMGGGAKPYPILVHADWFGFTLADLVFPSFLFTVGAAMAFGPSLSGAQFWSKTARRTAMLFLLGFLMYWFPFVHQTPEGIWALNPLGETRIMGVLQRIALCFGCAAIATRYLTVRQLLGLSALLLFGYWAILGWGAPAGQAYSKMGNIGSRLDQLILGQAHLYRWEDGFEPEGILSTLPAIVNVMGGYLMGRFIKNNRDHLEKAIRQSLVVGLICIGIALLWNPFFPITKRLWTSSFVLLTLGLDLLILSVLIGFVDLKQQRFGVRFFEIFGQNSIVIYLFSELLISVNYLFKLPDGHDPYGWFGIVIWQSLLPGALGSLMCAICYMFLCWGLAYILDARASSVKVVATLTKK